MTSSGVTFTGESAPVARETVTVLSGASFVLSRSNGDIDADAPLGFFGHDTRLLSGWALEIDGVRPEPLTHYLPAPWRCRFISRVFTDAHRLLVERARYVDEAVREDLIIRNLHADPVTLNVRIRFQADFASLFEVKESRVPSGTATRVRLTDTGVCLLRRVDEGESGLGVDVNAAGAEVGPETVDFVAEIPGRGEWQATVHVQPVIDGAPIPARFPDGHPLTETAAAVRQRQWEHGTAEMRSSNPDFDEALRRARHDLGSLRVFDEGSDRPVLAAGSPWFMTLFGRDSLLTSYMTLALDPTLAEGVLDALAHRQGEHVVERTEEEPGRILHELRFDEADDATDAALPYGSGPGTAAGQTGRHAYYGTADATPLFVALVGEYARWHGQCTTVMRMLPAVDRALEWIDRYGDRDGDGFVEYERATPSGLVNQGWKDSWDGINFADGTIAEAPIALCEVQGYVYAAFSARAALAELCSDPELAEHWQQRAARLKTAFNERFWLPERGWFAVGLDKDKRPIDALASNMGHALWTGIVDEEYAPAVARHLVSDELFSGWGVRTLATTMGAYDPMSYHNGSVWPHDNALIAYGLMHRGFVEEGHRIAEGILDAAAASGGRLPELFAGLERDAYPVPVPYPTACSPQAWASAVPIHLARSLLGLEPEVHHGLLRARPRVPARLGTLAVTGLPLAGGRLQLRAEGSHIDAAGIPDGFQWVVEGLVGQDVAP
ncbi:glycogen debranching N-terminal domain-containing protein [Intrasporangium sp.]|uniref:amylo-alpha-1,6-glucosidase n=1 Tax=Intrasporangium sp. TaxID=1925024 RepID=UPI00336572A1